MTVDFSGQVRARLNPVLGPAGFAAAQGGFDEDTGRGQLIFCAAQDDLGERFPLLPRTWEPEPGAGRCVDLVVDLDATSIRGVGLEGQPLADTLRATGQRALAETVLNLDTLSGHEALDRVTLALVALFSTSEPE